MDDNIVQSCVVCNTEKRRECKTCKFKGVLKL